VTTPYLQSLVGSFTLAGQTPQEARQFTVNNHAVRTDKNGFTLALDAAVNAGRLRHQIAAATVAPGVLVYLDRVTALGDVTVTEERSLVVGVENDEVSGGKRQIETGANKKLTVIGGETDDHALSGNWANVDGRLGLVAAPGSQLLYRAVGKPNRAGAREDFLYGQFRSGTARNFKQGSVVAERAGLLLPGASPAETARIAASLKIEQNAGGRTMRFTGPNGRTHVLTLSSDGTVTWQGQSVRPAATAPKTASAQKSEN
jgi:hypothetical protein